MAATGFTPISLYYSTTAAAVPLAGNLANGELALNTADMKLYAKNSSGTVTLLASNAATSGVSSFSAGSTGFTPSTATTGAVTLAGTLATTNGGTGLTSFTSGGVVYASSTSALATGSALTFNGSVLGISTTPSAWSASYRTLQSGTGSAFVGFNGNDQTFVVSNAYNDGAWKYINTSGAGYYQVAGVANGGHYWYTAPSGTAGTAITFTQRMTLDSSGNLGIGTASPADRLHVKVDGNANNGVRFENADTGSSALVNVKLVSGGADGGIACTSSTYTAGAVITSDCTYVYASGTSSNGLRLNAEASAPIVFGTNNTEKARLSSAGGFGVGTTADPGIGAIYATGNITAYYSSDIKFKENVRDIPDALATVNAIGGKLFDWTDDYIESKGGADGYFVQKADFGVVAQDVQKVFPIAVRTREDGSLAVDYEKLGALAFAALVELTKRVEALEAK